MGYLAVFGVGTIAGMMLITASIAAPTLLATRRFAGMNHTLGRVTCCTALKTNGLKQLLEQKGYTGVILGVRADEEGTRAKERYFSPRDKHGDWDFRDQPPELCPVTKRAVGVATVRKCSST